MVIALIGFQVLVRAIRRYLATRENRSPFADRTSLPVYGGSSAAAVVPLQ